MKISTWRPEPDKSEMYYSAGEIHVELFEFLKNWKKVVDRLHEYPPTDDKVDLETANRLLVFADVVKCLNLFLPSLVDQRQAYCKMAWWRILLDERQYTKHAAAMKNKIEIIENGKPTGKFQAVTNKSINKKKEKIARDYEETEQITTVPKMWLEWMNGLVQWREVESKMGGSIAARRAKLHDKLSESAFGKS